MSAAGIEIARLERKIQKLESDRDQVNGHLCKIAGYAQAVELLRDKFKSDLQLLRAALLELYEYGHTHPNSENNVAFSQALKNAEKLLGLKCSSCRGRGWIYLPDNESRECECKFTL